MSDTFINVKNEDGNDLDFQMDITNVPFFSLSDFVTHCVSLSLSLSLFVCLT